MAKETYYIWQKRPTAPDTPIFIHTLSHAWVAKIVLFQKTKRGFRV